MTVLCRRFSLILVILQGPTGEDGVDFVAGNRSDLVLRGPLPDNFLTGLVLLFYDDHGFLDYLSFYLLTNRG